MNIGIIAGASFFKNESYYIASLLANRLQGTGHKVILLNKTARDFSLPGIINLPIRPGITGMLTGNSISAFAKKHAIERFLVFDSNDLTGKKQVQCLILIDDEWPVEAVNKNSSKNLRIITFLNAQYQKLLQNGSALQQRMLLAKPAVLLVLTPLDYEKRSEAKEQFADGKEYFVYADVSAGQQAFINLLKAFSAFKKMQLSNWKLVVLLRGGLSDKEKEEWLRLLGSFKFRNDVKIINNESAGETALCIAGAYALLSFSENKAYSPSVIESLLCHVPVIVQASDWQQQFAGAVIEASSSAPEAVAEKMMTLYKDESLRSRLSLQAAGIMRDFKAEQHIAALTEYIVSS